MRLVWFSLLCAITILNACSTTEHIQKTYNTTHWSSLEPLSIPYDIRLNQFERGNLVINPSFEEGLAVQSTAGNKDRIKGWQKVGRNVYWADRKSAEYRAKDVNSGRYAVKIVREKANELDEAEGVITDYIEVIPGNYYFTYHVKLKNISSNKYRLGVQLYDAVEIKVLFFDQDKQPIESGILNPVSKSLIDNSDKGYSFSNYWTIDEFPWAKIRGRTYNYPFSEGDIPDRTRYVRLFFGLKGTGSMWVDDIVYRYSKWNFTALERLKPYFVRTLALEKRIIPTPKRFQWLNDVVFYDERLPNSHLPVIVLPQNPAAADFTAAKLLQQQIRMLLDRVMPANRIDDTIPRIVEKDFSLKDILAAKLIFSIGTNRIHQTVQPRLSLTAISDKQQGYIIEAVQVGSTYIVFLTGASPLGNFYAATTAVQLFEQDKAVYHNATVVDYPDFLGRSYLFKDWQNTEELQNDLNSVARMSFYKLNKVYLGYNRTNKNWHQPDDLYRTGIEAAGKLCRQSGVMSLALMLNPYSHFGFEKSAEQLGHQLRYTWTHSSPASLEMLKKVYKLALEAGANTIMLLADDSVPHSGKNRQNYSLYTVEDKKRFVALQNAQAHIINNLKQWINSDYPGTRMEFCPPWYSNEHIDRSDGKAENYFKGLTFQIPRDVAVIWTGPTVRSLSIDMADLYRYKSLIGRWPMIWDNTLYARNLETKRYGGYTAHYPGKVRMCNLFEPHDTYRPLDFHQFNDGRQMYTNGTAYSEIYKIKYATVADYEWNTAAYNPELALWKALIRIYDPQSAKLLLRFNDAYYGVYEMCLRLENEGIKPEYIENGKKYLAKMTDHLLDINAALPGQKKLFKELEYYLDKQKKRFARINNDRIKPYPNTP